MSYGFSPVTGSTMRSRDELYRHYMVEKELAARLRSADREERKRLYGHLYDELFERVPDHPQLRSKDDPEGRRRFVEIEMSLVGRYLRPGDTFMEIGCGDCSLSFEAARHVGKVYGVDVSRAITRGDTIPGNFELLISDGIDVDVQPESVDVAYSRNLIEHLHPDDTVEHVEGVYKALKKGGLYICMTPHRFSGPHDISQFFERKASGFHLHEYTYAEIVSIFRDAGFGKIRSCKRLGLRYLTVPNLPIRILEGLLGTLPYRPRRAVTSFLFGLVRIIAEK